MKWPLWNGCKWYLASLVLAGSVQAADVYPLVTYTCDTASNQLKIKSEIKYDDEGRAIVYNSAQGTYNPWTWVDIAEASVGNRLITKKPPIELTCNLGNFKYRILLEAKIFNRNYDGNCGNRISVIATIFRGSNLLLDHKEFEAFCHGNSPIVRGVRIAGESGVMDVVTVPKYQFY